MAQKAKSSPIRIIFYGGALATILYLLWTNYGSSIIQNSYKPKRSSRVVVKDVLKKSRKTKQSLSFKKTKTEKKIDKPEVNEFGLIPITEDQRQQLIEKAKQSLETRLDPFGQEVALPPSSISSQDKKPPQIPESNVQRKQIELVGVVSTNSKDLALVNVYTAEFIIKADDDENKLEDELKKSLVMANPDRLEVYILDPVEDWYIKAINKSKTRSDEPSIDLVKGNKKFNLKVGQKVLLPAEKQLKDVLKDLQKQQESLEDLGLY